MDKSNNKSSSKKVSKKEDIIINEKAVRTLAKLLEETNLTEIEYQVGEHRVRVARGGFVTHAPSVAAASVPHPIASLSQDKASQPVPTPPRGDSVLSPMVGTAYLAPEPGAPTFVKIGDTVKKGETLLIIEAMKVMNPIRAPRDGKVLEILITDANPVEFGEVLLILE